MLMRWWDDLRVIEEVGRDLHEGVGGSTPRGIGCVMDDREESVLVSS
jgi:hypothetical protein